eukprot:jgi/Bigna1/77483/fgenesh1_pg.48_\
MTLLVTAIAAFSLALPVRSDPDMPHLTQAWQAESTGDGLPGAVGKESYIYEECKKTSETCLQAHIFDYGADNCIKIEVNGGFKYPYGAVGSGTYYVKCESVDCCYAGQGTDVPSIKKWDIGPENLLTKVKYLGKRDTTELFNNSVHGAEVWSQTTSIPFSKIGIDYTFYVTRKTNPDNTTDVVTHRIDYSVPGDTKVKAGSILYGDFKVIKNITAFRDYFRPPPVCEASSVRSCDAEKVRQWESKYFSRSQPPQYATDKGSCTGPHEFCCPAPMDDVNNCPAGARTSDCDAKKSCCCA